MIIASLTHATPVFVCIITHTNTSCVFCREKLVLKEKRDTQAEMEITETLVQKDPLYAPLTTHSPSIY